MADLIELDRAEAVKIAGANPSTGVADNYMEVDSSGRLTVKLNDAAGSAITLGQTTMSASIPIVLSSDQTGINTFLDKTNSGTITALNGTTVAATNGCSSVTFDVTGTWVATIIIEGTTGDGNWFIINGDVDVSDTISSSFTANTFVTVPCGSFSQVRIRASLFTSGTVSVNWNSSNGINTIEVFNTTPGSLLATVTQGTANTLANAWPQKITDGTNGPVAVKGASVVPLATDPALVVSISPNTPVLTVTTSPLPASGSKFSFGQLTTTTSVSFLPVEFTAYTEPTTNSAMTIVSSSANDTSAGTGARTITVTFLDQTGAGPFTTIFTMNGVTPVTAGVSNICFVEKIAVTTVGSTLSNVGTITLKTGGGTTVGTIVAIGNQTFWAHHYVPTGKTCYISGFSFGNNGTANGNGAQFVLKESTPTIANTPELQISDFVVSAGIASTDTRTYISPIQVAGPARVRAYVLPFANASVTQFASFDFIDN